MDKILKIIEYFTVILIIIAGLHTYNLMKDKIELQSRAEIQSIQLNTCFTRFRDYVDEVYYGCSNGYDKCQEIIYN